MRPRRAASLIARPLNASVRRPMRNLVAVRALVFCSAILMTRAAIADTEQLPTCGKDVAWVGTSTTWDEDLCDLKLVSADAVVAFVVDTAGHVVAPTIVKITVEPAELEPCARRKVLSNAGDLRWTKPIAPCRKTTKIRLRVKGDA